MGYDTDTHSIRYIISNPTRALVNYVYIGDSDKYVSSPQTNTETIKMECFIDEEGARPCLGRLQTTRQQTKNNKLF